MFYSGLTDSWDWDGLQCGFMAPIQVKKKYHSLYHEAQ